MRVGVRAGVMETMAPWGLDAVKHQSSTQDPNDGTAAFLKNADSWWTFLFRSQVT